MGLRYILDFLKQDMNYQGVYMRMDHAMVPHLTTANTRPLFALEKIILDQAANIEAWFRREWQKTPPPITSSVDLRNAGFKLAPVDTNLFPAGFNNLNPEFMPLCIQAVQSTLIDMAPSCRRLVIVPENHTRNKYYLQSLAVLESIFRKAGFEVRIGSLDPELHETREITLENDEKIIISPLVREQDYLKLDDFIPCLLVLNNDLSDGLPPALENIKQRVMPSARLGWHARSKSDHFSLYTQVAQEFAQITSIDPWLIYPISRVVHGIDFMATEGMDKLAAEVDFVLAATREKYQQYGIGDRPYAVVKADNGTYGMSVMMVYDAKQVQQLNRKQRTKMSATKGSQKVERLLIQEGIYTFETMPDGAVAEPVIYMLGQYVVGGFYRVHQGRDIDENLNAPGMYFEPLAFAQPCNTPCPEKDPGECINRFYSYGVIARLAALAAARENARVGG